jgi:two-component system OmpR family response regulator
MSRRILVVDDDPHIREVVRFALEKAGYETIAAKDGREALARAASGRPALIVLDIGLPELDGLEVCRRLRKTSETPILFLSARDEEIDRILGLEMGGDDYLTKPFSPRELTARVAAILKRASAPRAEPMPESLAHGALRLDPAAHRAQAGGVELALTAIEFEVLRALMARPGLVFTRERLLDAAWSGVNVSDRTVDSHIRNLRAKLAQAGCADAVETVHGVGFRLGPCSGTSAGPAR